MLALSGELDLATAPALAEALAADRGGEPLVVDLSAVDFMDLSGLRALAVTTLSRAEDGERLAIVCAGPVRRIFELAPIAPFPLYPSREAAVAGLELP